ncbi:MAG: transketolase C-terminal domain-containing protein, partial [Pseudomonadota bacterium]|nr:transketolase C-terminal domain-containing protein [Pseudomonadota bacterium]
MSPETAGAPKVTLIATGSEVAIAHDAQKQLEADGTSTRLVSVPSLDILLAQEQSYIDSLLGTDTRLVII